MPFLRAARGRPVTISARAVARIDTRRLQILLVAQQHWRRADLGFALIDMDPRCREGLDRLGLPRDQFDKETPQ